MVRIRGLEILVSMTVLAAATVCATTSSQPTVEQILKWRIAYPPPEYPLEARAHDLAGSGIFKAHFYIKTGTVRQIEIVKSTGHRILDTAAIKAFSRWKF